MEALQDWKIDWWYPAGLYPYGKPCNKTMQTRRIRRKKKCNMK
jgi:hypothetical protein